MSRLLLGSLSLHRHLGVGQELVHLLLLLLQRLRQPRLQLGQHLHLCGLELWERRHCLLLEELG